MNKYFILFDSASFGQAYFSELAWQGFIRTSQFFYCDPRPNNRLLPQALDLIDRKSLIQKTDFMSKFSRIYSRTLLQSLLIPLYFISFDWLPFVKASYDWPVQIVSGSFGVLLMLVSRSSELQFMFLYAFPVTCISCRDCPLGKCHVLSVDISLWFLWGDLTLLSLDNSLSDSIALATVWQPAFIGCHILSLLLLSSGLLAFP